MYSQDMWGKVRKIYSQLQLIPSGLELFETEGRGRFGDELDGLSFTYRILFILVCDI